MHAALLLHYLRDIRNVVNKYQALLALYQLSCVYIYAVIVLQVAEMYRSQDQIKNQTSDKKDAENEEFY